MSRKLALTVVAAAGLGLTSLTAHATGTAGFGTGTPGFSVSTAPSTLKCADCAGEPSIGIDWRTGTGLYMNADTVEQLTFDNAAGAVRWADAPGVPNGLMENEDPILVTEPHSGLTLAGGDTFACNAMYATTDDGASFTPSVPCTGTIDHPTVGFAPSALLPGKTVYYYCQHTVLQQCATSVTDGAAWTPAGPVGPAGCTDQHGHLKGSPDGTAYLPSKKCTTQSDFVAGTVNGFGVGGLDWPKLGGARTSNDGLTWTAYVIPGASARGFDPAVATTPDNSLYEAWQAGANSHPMIAVSHTHGDSWSTPVDLAGTVSPPLVASTFPTLVAGDNGRLAYSFLGTSVGSGDPNALGFHGVWYLYTSYTFDGGQTWTTVQDTLTPVQVGEIDSGGVSTAGQRNLYDFIDSSVTKDGRVVVAFADGCLADCEAQVAAGNLAAAEARSTHKWANVAYQTAGEGLFGAGA